MRRQVHHTVSLLFLATLASAVPTQAAYESYVTIEGTKQGKQDKQDKPPPTKKDAAVNPQQQAPAPGASAPGAYPSGRLNLNRAGRP